MPDVPDVDPATATPVEIDTVLAALSARCSRLGAYLASTQDAIRRERARLDLRGAKASHRLADLAEQRDGYRAQLTELQTRMAPYHEAWQTRGRWHRYFLVEQANGHVHRNQTCTTCYPTTEYRWLVELSDCDEDQMLTDYGEKACSVCFPGAPTDPRYRAPGRLAREEAERRAAEKAEKARAKAAKAIVNPDGSVLRTRRHGEVRTEVTAQNEYVDSLAYARGLRQRAERNPGEYGHLAGIAQECEIDARLLLVALAAKRGMAEDDVAASLADKVTRKFRRDYDY